MKLNLYQIDAFAERAFQGNPAAVCPLEAWLDDSLMQAIAEENNLSETAFFVAEGDGYRLRWFTPVSEVELCGHATLASAFVIYELLRAARDKIVFQSLSGPLTVRRDDGALIMDFPIWNLEDVAEPRPIADALGGDAKGVWSAGRDFLVEYGSEREVRALEPDLAALKRLGKYGFIATAPGEEYDCVSRFFAPAYGVEEDPVTGSAHSAIVPFWSRRMERNEICAFQASERGGALDCLLRGDRVDIGGRCVHYMTGEIHV